MSDNELYSLSWKNFNTNLSASFHESLCRGDLVDVTLAADGLLLKAHRLVLSASSSYFQEMFTHMPTNQQAFVFLKDVSQTTLNDLITFIYCGEVNVKEDTLPAFMSVAKALQIKGLMESDNSVPVSQTTSESIPKPYKKITKSRPTSVPVAVPSTSQASAVKRVRHPSPSQNEPTFKRTKATTDPLENVESIEESTQITVKEEKDDEPIPFSIETLNTYTDPGYEVPLVMEEKAQDHDTTTYYGNEADDTDYFNETDKIGLLPSLSKSYWVVGPGGKKGQFIRTSKGFLQLFVDGQKFGYKRQSKSGRDWLCSRQARYGCTSVVKTDLHHTKIVAFRGFHNHDIDERS